MRPIQVVVGPLAAAAANNIALSQTPSGAGNLTLNGSLASGGVATLDKARRVRITSAGNDSGVTFTITGTNWSGNSASETLTGANATTADSVLSYKTVTQIAISAAAAAGVTVGTNGVADSPWVRFDDYANAQVTLQCVVSGTANYTVQETMDDPNDPANPVAAASVTWSSSGDSAVVTATGTQLSSFTFAPRYARVLLNSGTGTVTMTTTQLSAVPY